MNPAPMKTEPAPRAVFVVCGKNALRYSIEAPVLEKAHEQKFNYLGESKMRKKNVPDRIHLSSHVFNINAIGEARPFPDGTAPYRLTEDDSASYLAKLAEIERLRKEASQFLRESVQRGSRVTKADCA